MFGVGFVLAGASSNLMPSTLLRGPGLGVSCLTSGCPLREYLSVLPGEFSRLSISIGSGPFSNSMSSTSTGVAELGRLGSGCGNPPMGICDAGIIPVYGSPFTG